jgi:hypothetical protein
VGLNGRVVKLESRLATLTLESDVSVQLWSDLFASARRCPEGREPTEGHILEADRVAAREFLATCRGIEMKPSISTMNILAHCQTES